MISSVEKPRDSLYASFFNKAAGGFLIFDEQLRLLDLNKSATRILRVQRAALLGKSLEELSPAANGNRYQKYLQVVKNGKPLRFKNVSVRTDDGHIKLDIIAFRAGGGLGIVLVDVTEYNHTLDELNLLMYKLSHDLRSPNSAIRGLVGLARVDAKDRAAFQDYLKIIDLEARKLDAILKELERSVEIRTGSAVISHIQFQPLIDLILQSLSTVPGFQDVRIDRNIEVHKEFYCYAFALTTIIQNLIVNGIQYRKQNSKDASISITITEQNKGVQITIADNGVGIEKRLVPGIFKIFFKASHNTKGSGLGLFTVKNSVRALRGKITVESIIDRGTTFSIYVPNTKTDSAT